MSVHVVPYVKISGSFLKPSESGPCVCTMLGIAESNNEATADSRTL
jgi:hypothetical protein